MIDDETNSKTVKIIDFGQIETFEFADLLTDNNDAPMRGSKSFKSINAHKRHTLSRKDDW